MSDTAVLKWYVESMKNIEQTEPDQNQSEFALDLIFTIRNFARRARIQVEENESYKKMILRDEQQYE